MIRSPPTRKAFIASLIGCACVVGVLGEGIRGAVERDVVVKTKVKERRVMIKYKSLDGQLDVSKKATKVHKHLKKENAIAGTFSEEDIEALKNNAEIDYVEDDPLVSLDCAGPQRMPYGVKMVQQTVNIGDWIIAATDDSGNPKKTVCIVDSGLDRSHEDMQQMNVVGKSFGNPGPWDSPGNPHGTHVAGTIAALDNGCGVVGVEPNSGLRILIARVFNDDNDSAWTSDIIAAAEWCEESGANVINMSLGGPAKSNTAETAYKQIYDKGALIIAAAGNDGSERHHYPASFDDVMSVAAVNINGDVADFSQRNDQVEISAPGDGILSTMPTGMGAVDAFLAVGGVQYQSANHMTNAPVQDATGVLVDCGIGDTTCDNASGGKDHICVMERGMITFKEKVLNCESSGGVAAIIYNNKDSGATIYGTLGNDNPPAAIPAIGITKLHGEDIKSKMGQTATMEFTKTNYGEMWGTSMATPHVAGVAALVWSHHPFCTNQEIRDALTATAVNTAEGTRNNEIGYGIVQAQAAMQFLDENRCEAAPVIPPATTTTTTTTTTLPSGGTAGFTPTTSAYIIIRDKRGKKRKFKTKTRPPWQG